MTNNNSNNDIFKFWFPEQTEEIIVITSEEPDSKKSEDARTTSENYQFLNNVGDIDTLLEVVMFLSRYYPKAKIKRLFPREFNERDDFDKNLVIIGGPVNNTICMRVMRRMNSKIKYSKTEWNMQVEGKSYNYIYSEQTGMEKDFGYFSSIQNPFRRSNRIILINGLNTFGVLGAFRAFSDIEESYTNYIAIKERMKHEKLSTINFECFFEVIVNNCSLKDCTKVVIDCPIINKQDVFVMSYDITKLEIETNELKNKIIILVEIAIQQAIVGFRKTNLSNLLTDLKNKNEVRSETLSEINSICESNLTIPDENIAQIINLLKN